MLQPAQRKLKPVDQLNSLLSQQTAKLAWRGRQILDILDDVRLLGKQKSELEQQYAQSLLKLTKQLLSKKDLFPSQSIRADVNSNKRTVNAAWRTILEETQTLAWHRIKAAEQYSERVCEPSRLLKERVTTAVKRGLDRLKVVQDDLVQSAKEMADRYKLHAEDEAASVDALNKLNDENVRLQKNPRASTVTLLKVRERREMCAAKAIRTRNSYMIEWAATNAHLRLYHEAQLPDLYKVLGTGVFAQISDIMSAMVKADQEMCTAMTTMQKKVQECASSVNHDFDLQCFIDGNPEFSEPLQFECEATCDLQATASLTTAQSESHYLNQEVRKWAAKISNERLLEQKVQKQLGALETEDPSPYVSMLPSDSAGACKKKPAPENSVDQTEQEKLHMSIQRSQIGITKASARLDLIKGAGIDVASILRDSGPAQTDRSDTLSVNSASSSGGPSGGSLPPGLLHSPVSSETAAFQPYLVVAIYAHEPRVPDELCLNVGDVFTVLRPAADDGWVGARDALGNEGLLPLNYVEGLPDDGGPAEPRVGCYEVLPPINHTTSIEDEYVLPENRAVEIVPSAREVMPPPDETPQSSNVGSLPGENVSPLPVLRRPAPKPAPRPPSVAFSPRPHPSVEPVDDYGSSVVWLRALYDYTALNEEELSFSSDDRIALVSKDDSTGDGFWKGQLSNGCVGVFPSILVEEIEDHCAQVLPSDPQFSASE